MLTLRDYQQEALTAILHEYQAGITRQLVALATGTGKTVLFGALAKELNTRTVIIAHREELLMQAADKIKLVWPEADIGICKAELNELNHQLIIGSIQTISRPNRLQQLKEQNFKLMVIDESHHAVSESYMEVIKALGFMDDKPDRLLLGVTATPWRLDKQGLNNIFQKVVFQRSLPTMIKAGYLCDLKAIRIKVAGTNLNGVHVRMGDFAPGELESVINTEQRNEVIVKAFKRYASNRKAAAFCVGVQHAKDLAEAFNGAGIKASAVYGNMDPADRKATLQAYAAGKIQMLTNVGVLTEGWDDPATSCLLMARPTKSSALYTQMLGRGTRLFPGKENCLVLEFTDNSHDVCNLGNLTGLPLKNKQSLKKAIQENEERQEKECQDTAARTIKKAVVKEYDLFDRSRFRWFAVGNDWRLPLEPGKYIFLHQVEAGKYDVLLVNQEQKTTSLSSNLLPLGYAQGISEDYARQNGNESFTNKNAKWTKRPASEKQRTAMDHLRIEYPPDITAGAASSLIGAEVARQQAANSEPATSRQLWKLRRMNIRHPPNIGKREAQRLISCGLKK